MDQGALPAIWVDGLRVCPPGGKSFGSLGRQLYVCFVPAGCTAHLQPLDVGCFGPLKAFDVKRLAQTGVLQQDGLAFGNQQSCCRIFAGEALGPSFSPVWGDRKPSCFAWIVSQEPSTLQPWTFAIPEDITDVLHVFPTIQGNFLLDVAMAIKIVIPQNRCYVPYRLVFWWVAIGFAKCMGKLPLCWIVLGIFWMRIQKKTISLEKTICLQTLSDRPEQGHCPSTNGAWQPGGKFPKWNSCVDPPYLIEWYKIHTNQCFCWVSWP